MLRRPKRVVALLTKLLDQRSAFTVVLGGNLCICVFHADIYSSTVFDDEAASQVCRLNTGPEVSE